MNVLLASAVVTTAAEPEPTASFADNVILPVAVVVYALYVGMMVYTQARDARMNNWSGKSDVILRHMGCWTAWGLLFICSFFISEDWIRQIDQPNVGIWHVLLYAWWWIASPIAFVAGPAMMTFNKSHRSHTAATFWRRLWQFLFVCSGWWLGAYLNLIDFFY